jgi:hypothetical protein
MESEYLTASTDDAMMRVLTSDSLMERLQWARAAGVTFNGKRDLYEAFGYKRNVTVGDMFERYTRGGIAARVVDALPAATWRGGFELIQSENPKTKTPFEVAWNKLSKRLQLPTMFERGDKVSRLSTFAVLLIGAPELYNTPLPKGNGNPDSIAYVSLYLGAGGQSVLPSTLSTALQGLQGDITIEQWDEDTASSRFGQPLFYKIRRLDRVFTKELPPVHWSRVVHLAEGCLLDNVYGQPVLLRGWNLFDDLDKVSGGGAEAFFKRADQGRVWKVDKDIPNLSDKEKQAMREGIERLQNGMERDVRVHGVDVQTLGSDVANFQSPLDAITTLIAGTYAMPKRILTGSEMGELASSQDRDNWVDQINGRRDGYAGPSIVLRFVDRLREFNYLPPVDEYSIRWGNILNRTEAEKVAGAKSWAETGNASEGPAFTNDEVRDYWFGMAPLTPEQKALLKPPAPIAPADNTDNADSNMFPRAAEGKLTDEQLITLLEKALFEDNETEVEAVLALCGGPGSGNFGHGGRPGEIGGSSDSESGPTQRTEKVVFDGKPRVIRDIHVVKGKHVGRMKLGGSETLVAKEKGTWKVADDITWNDFYNSDEWQLHGDAIKLKK